jgi:MFS family permease
MLSVLGNVTYRRLFAAQVASLIGTGIATVALALLAYDLSGGEAGAVLGTALALKMIAYVFVTPVVGGMAHLLPRRTFLIALDVARAAIISCLPFVTEIWQIYVLIVLLNVCSAGFTPTFQATIPDVLPDEEDYTRALSLSRLAYDLENLVSPTLAAAALLLVSYDALFMFNAGTFLLSAALLLTLSLPTAKPPERESGIWRNTAFGIRSYLRTPRLRGLLALCMSASAAGAMVIVNTVVYVRAYLGGSETDTAIALAGFGFGSMVAALALPGWLKKYPDRRFMLTGGVLLMVGLLAGMIGPAMPGVVAIWVLLGLGSSLIQTPAGRLLVRSSQPGDRPAFYAAHFALSHACWLITYPLAGWVGAGVSLTVAFAILAGVALLSLLAALAFWRAESRTPLLHRHDAVCHEHLHEHDEHHQHEHEGHEGDEPHSHPHQHEAIEHRHEFIIDLHHPVWPTGRATHSGNH